VRYTSETPPIVPFTATAIAGALTAVAPSSLPVTIAGTCPLDGSIVRRSVGGVMVACRELRPAAPTAGGRPADQHPVLADPVQPDGAVLRSQEPVGHPAQRQREVGRPVELHAAGRSRAEVEGLAGALAGAPAERRDAVDGPWQLDAEGVGDGGEQVDVLPVAVGDLGDGLPGLL
jgi:hypothetical protein